MSLLKRIAGFTLVTSALDAVVEGYAQALQYRPTGSGVISRSLAQSWHAPRCTGRRLALLEPRGRPGTGLRVIEAAVATPAATAPAPFRTLGWSAAELIVQDVDALAIELEDSAFRCLRPPADLSFSDQIRAMQVQGPGGEVLYLTQVKSTIAGMDLPVTEQAVGPPFILVLGAGSLHATRQWFHETLRLPASPVQSVRMSALSSAWELPLDTRHELCAMPLGGQCYIEIDAMPGGAAARGVAPGELPLGIAIVSFEVQRLPAGLPYLQPPRRYPKAPYLERRAGVLRGIDGELVELIETGPTP